MSYFRISRNSSEWTFFSLGCCNALGWTKIHTRTPSKFSVWLPLRHSQYADSCIEENSETLLGLSEHFRACWWQWYWGCRSFGELHFIAKRVEKRALPQNSLQFIAQENVAASVTNVFFICSRAWRTLAVSVVCGSCVFTL